MKMIIDARGAVEPRRRTPNVLGVVSTDIIFAVCVGLYLAIASLVYAGTMANLQYDCHHRWSNICDSHIIATDRGLAAVSAMLPPGWIVGFVMAGGFDRGFTFESTPDISDIERYQSPGASDPESSLRRRRGEHD